MKKYYPVDSLKAPKFCGVRTFMRLPHITEVKGNGKDIDVAFAGIPFDTGGSYRTGQRFGPEAIRDVSVMVRRYNPIQKVEIFEHISGIDYGDFPVVPGNIEETYRLIEEEMTALLDNGIVPICMGGDHSITLGELRAVAKKYGPVALVHFDAHNDTDDEPFGLKYNHGTPFRWAAHEGLLDLDHSISVGMRGSMYHPHEYEEAEKIGIKVITADMMRTMGFAQVTKEIKERVGEAPVFFSFDIDFCDPASAPGTGTVEVEGFNSHETLSLIRSLASLHFVAFDMVEMLPTYDHNQITANLISHVGYEFASIMALHYKNNSPYLEKIRKNK